MKKNIVNKILFFVALAIFVTSVCFLPESIISILNDVKHPGKTGIKVSPADQHLDDINHTKLRIVLSGIDEIKKNATFTVTGEHVCKKDCGTYTDKIQFYQVDHDDAESDDIPAFAVVNIPNITDDISASFTLPIRGSIITYPFDSYEQGLGIAYHKVAADKSIINVPIEEAKKEIQIHFDEEVSKLEMIDFDVIKPESVKPKGAEFDYVYAFTSHYARPMYIMLIIPIIVLVTACVTIYMQCTQPFDKLVTSSAATTLGVFGARSLILSGIPSDVTVVDTIFLLIVLFNLLALTFRGMTHFHDQAELKILPGSKKQP